MEDQVTEVQGTAQDTIAGVMVKYHEEPCWTFT